MSFLTPIALSGALIAIPIILLYMLRLRRREIIISSNFLWQQIIRDREANTPWQRLRRNLLLILQLFILALLVLALARPAQIVPTISAGKTVILLDASASMNTRDIDGKTRFEEAQDQANLILNEIGLEDEAAIIRVASTTETLISYTNDINALRKAINDAQPGYGNGDWDTALTLAAAGAQGVEDFSIIIISDGGLGDTAQLPENIPQPAYIPIGTSSNNLAISALATRTLPGQPPQLFAQVQNFGDEAVDASLLIRLDGELWESVTRTISERSQRSFVFAVDEEFQTIQAELVYDGDAPVDFLEQDNIAYTVAGDTRTRRILLISNQPNVFLERILSSIPGVQVFRGNPARRSLPATDYDLYLFNQYLPAELPDADMLIIDPPTDSNLFTLGEPSQNTGVLRIDADTHPLTTFLNVNNISLREFVPISPVGDWAEAILSVQGGPILYSGEDEGRQIVLLAFDLLDSDLALNIAWPLFMANAMEWFAPANIISTGNAVEVGALVQIRPPLDADTIHITAPDGHVDVLEVDRDVLNFSGIHQPGFYNVDVFVGGEATESQIIAANLFGQAESKITPIAEDAIHVGGGIVDAEAEEQLGFREYWPVAAALGLLLLMLEWFLYFRRLRVPTEVHRDLRRTTARH